MSREAKIFSVNSRNLVEKRVKEYESFGWELLSIHGVDVSMSRETQNKVYAELVKYEHKYESLRLELDNIEPVFRPAPFNLLYVLIGLFFFILPGVLYIYIKIQEQKKFKIALQDYQDTKNRLEKEIEKVCNVSRATFFAKQNE